MPGLYDAYRAAREKADASTDPADHALSAALAGALDAEARAILDGDREPADLTGLPTPAECGYPSELHVERP